MIDKQVPSITPNSISKPSVIEKEQPRSLHQNSNTKDTENLKASAIIMSLNKENSKNQGYSRMPVLSKESSEFGIG